MADIQTRDDTQAITETTADNSLQTNNTKFCKHCGKKIAAAAIVCPACGCQVEEMKGQNSAPNITITNTNTNTNTNTVSGGTYERNKYVALVLCFFFGWLGAHKFYEGKTFLGVLYIFTVGLFVIGWAADFISLLFKPNPYYVRV